ncbi:MAG TPA: SAM-dependent methyltransferase [Dongiaceae bacterium]|jgi:23S rRNA (cytidine2498-2'-O)-methyltransferase|nr:SAM-dependent methyltransferase [Dongiaceae bacterium]
MAGRLTGYLAPEGHLEDLLAELGGVAEVHGRLVLAEGPVRPAAWTANIWRNPERLMIASIADGAAQLRSRQRNWALYPHRLHRRASLIAERLPHVSAKPLVFPAPVPRAPLGSWTMLDEATILASADCRSPFPNGEARFVEDREGPPNRAYLKLWEALTLIDRRPGLGDLCLDLGASPGGWSWVLAKLGARVIAVDKALLDPVIAAMPGIEQRQASAFSITPSSLGPVDWLFSDVICYPARLLTLVERWLASGTARNLLCTIKFQGATDHAIARRFAAIPGSRLMHLHHNKHELTWIRLA